MSRILSIIQNPLGLLYLLPALLLGLTLHEWGHAYAAYRCGDPTARNLGRMSLNPLDHLDLIGTLCLLLVGFGFIIGRNDAKAETPVPWPPHAKS